MTKLKGYYLKKRGKYWQFGRRDPETKVITWESLRTKSKDEANEKFLERVTGKANVDKLDDVKNDYTPDIEMFRSLFTGQLKNVVSKGTLNSYTSAWKSFCESFLKWHANKVALLREVTANDISLWLKDMSDAGKTNTSVNNYLANVKALLSRAAKWNYIETNPADAVEKLRVKEKPREALNKQDFIKLLEATETQELRDIFKFAVYTGCRIGEIVNLTWDCINYHSSQIHIKNTDTFTTKSGKNRAIPITKTTRDILDRRKTVRTSGEGLVFHHRGGYQISQDVLNRKFKAACQKAELSDKLTFHNLRHTAISWMLEAGVDITSVKEIVGHSSTALIDKIYSHITQNHKLEELKKIENI